MKSIISPVTILPVLQPIAISTRGKSFFGKLKAWMFQDRLWEVKEDFYFYFEKYQMTLKVPKGFVFDGASVPKIFWGLLTPTGILLIPGLFHDFAYRYECLINNEDYVIFAKKGKKFYDEVFLEIGKQVNEMGIVDGIATFAIKSFGFFAWNSRRKENAQVMNDFKVFKYYGCLNND